MYACPCRVPRKQREVCSRHGARICSAVMVTAEAPAGTPGICWEKLCNWVSLRVHSITNTRRCIIQLLPAGSRWRLLRIPRGLFKLTNTTDSIPLLKAFIPSQSLMNSVAKLSSSMVALALHRTPRGRGATRHVCAKMLPRLEMIPSTLGGRVRRASVCLLSALVQACVEIAT